MTYERLWKNGVKRQTCKVQYKSFDVHIYIYTHTQTHAHTHTHLREVHDDIC